MHFSKHQKQHWKQQRIAFAILESISSAFFCICAINARIILMMAMRSAPNAAVPLWYQIEVVALFITVRLPISSLSLQKYHLLTAIAKTISPIARMNCPDQKKQKSRYQPHCLTKSENSKVLTCGREEDNGGTYVRSRKAILLCLPDTHRDGYWTSRDGIGRKFSHTSQVHCIHTPDYHKHHEAESLNDWKENDYRHGDDCFTGLLHTPHGKLYPFSHE